MSNSNPIGFGSFGPDAGQYRRARATSVPAGVPRSQVQVTDPSVRYTAPVNTIPRSIGSNPDEVRSLQQYLHSHGYNIAVDGLMGPITQAALADFKSGRNAKAFNASLLAHDAASHAASHPAGSGSGGTGDPSSGLGAGGGTGGADPFGAIITGLLKGANVGTMMDPAMAENITASTYDPQIQAAKDAITRQGLQRDMNLTDLSNWYGLNPNDPSFKLSVLGMLAKARAADSAESTAASGATSDAARAIAASLGGSANPGSAGVLSEGANQADLMSALGKNVADYQDILAPLLQAEGATQISNERARQDNIGADNQAKLLQLLGEKGAMAGDNLLKITEANNQLAQQRYGNRAGLMSTLAAMQTAGLDTNYKQLRNALEQKKVDAFGKPKPTTISPSTLSGITKDITSSLVDPTTHKLNPNASIQDIVRVAKARAAMSGLDWHNPKVASALMAAIRALGTDSKGQPIIPDPRWFGQ